MLNKIKEYLMNHPNSSVWTAVVCSLTAMGTDEWVSLLAAVGLFCSTLFGLIQKAVEVYINYKENKIQKEHDRQVSLLKAQDESERYKVETQLLLAQIPLKQPILLTSTDNEDGNWTNGQ